MRERKLKWGGALTAMGLACAAPGLAHGQTEPVEPAAEPQIHPESPSGDIVVTARRVAERLQDVPISMTVFNQQQLNDRNILTGTDLAAYTPSMTVDNKYGAENTTFTIRGFSQEQRTTASVAVYFADVVSPRGGGSLPTGDGAGPGNFFDLQNVQVLKGPQGTLFGRNTTGGAVLLVPQKPKDTVEGFVEGSVGNYDMWRVQGVINLPLGDTARLRAGVDRQKRDGYLKNLSSVGPNAFNDIDYIAARISLVADLTPDLENYTIVSYALSENNGPLPKVDRCFVSAIPGGPLTCDQLAREAGSGPHTVSNDYADPTRRMEQWQIINTTTWLASDTLTIKNIASYSQLTNIIRGNGFGTNWIIPETFLGRPTGDLAGTSVPFVTLFETAGLATSDQYTFSEELQFQGKIGGDRLVWQAGGYFEMSKPLGLYGNQNPVLLSCTDPANYQCSDDLGRLFGIEGRLGSQTRQVSQTSYRNLAIYGQATYSLTEQLSFTGGLRYTWDRARSTASQVVYRYPTANEPIGFCNSPLVRDPRLPITSPDDCLEQFRASSSAPTWVLDVQYRPDPDAMIYAKYARGYRQGSTNPSAAAGFNTFGPEKVDTYEVGTKFTFSGAIRGYLNLAAFYSDFSEQQLSVAFSCSTSCVAPNTGIVNVGKSRIYGAEVEAHLTPFDGFTLDASYAYLNSRLNSLAPVILVPGSPYDIVDYSSVVGSELPLTPKHKGTVTATYHLPLPNEIGDVSIGATYTYTDKIRVSSASPRGILPAYSLFNLNVSWHSVMGAPVDISAFVTNLTNKVYYSSIQDLPSAGFTSYYIGEPRMIGARLRYRFGS